MPNPITTIIIDDQPNAIEDLLYLIERDELPVKILATANSGKEGLIAILKHKPQLVFLDVVMPGMTGFEMLELLPELNFHLIITTSDDQYAVQALRASALDFLLKPIMVKELKEAIERSINKQELPSKNQVSMLENSMRDRPAAMKKIALNVSDGVELVNVDDILFFESDGNYTTVVMKNNRSSVISKPIGKFEDMVDPSVFFRVHNSYLVNLFHVTKFVRSDGGYIVLENGKTISVARNRRDAFLEALSRLS
jgi:two-component system LytT family response regulator